MSTAPGYRPRGHSLRTTAAVLLTSLALAEAAVAALITVEVENRFRTIRGAEQERRFREEYDTYLRNAEIARLHYAEPSRTNYPTHWLAANAQYDQRWIHDPKRAVRLSVGDTGRDARCRWSIDGKEVGDTSCQGARAEIQLGERAVRVTVTRSDGSQFRDEQVVRLKDTLIVAIGDSYGAGEGVPHVLRRPPMSRGNRGRPAGWWDQRCHRSLFAGASLAAANRAERAPTDSVTFLSYACSGATIDEGLLGTYQGRETAGQVRETLAEHGIGLDALPPGERPFGGWHLPPQVDQAAAALCPVARVDGACPTSPRRPDYVILSTGGNEIGFGPAVAKFAMGCGPACLEELRGNLGKRFAELSDGYDRLAVALNGLHPHAVIATAYPDPSRREDGKTFCDDPRFYVWRPTFVPRELRTLGFLLGVGIRSEQSGFAHDHMLVPLNKTLAEAARRHGWRYADHIVGASRVKGYCAKGKRWFVLYKEAVLKQGVIPGDVERDARGNIIYRDKGGNIVPTGKGTSRIGEIASGAMHPNVFGQRSYAAAIQKSM